MSVHYQFTNASVPCTRNNRTGTITVYFQEDINLKPDKSITMDLPLTFNITKGGVLLQSADNRLVSLEQVFLIGKQEPFHLVFINRSYQNVEKSKGEPLCYLRHIG